MGKCPPTFLILPFSNTSDSKQTDTTYCQVLHSKYSETGNQLKPAGQVRQRLVSHPGCMGRRVADALIEKTVTATK